MIKKFTLWDNNIEMDHEAEVYCERYLKLKELLNKQLDGPILVIGDINKWDGRPVGYAVLGPDDNLNNILLMEESSLDYRWYCDGYNICCDIYDQNTIKHFVYREVKDLDNLQPFLNQILDGKNWKKTMSKYTKSIAMETGKLCGFCE